jgi:hypothetical protein
VPIVILSGIETYLQWKVPRIRAEFQWLITRKSDRFPEMDRVGLKKFMEHGFDPELGWVRKPDTSHEEKGKAGKTTWHTNHFGARINPGYENFTSDISCFGDSFTFCRQVNDNETWEHYLSQLTKSNVINWGIGNYGIDQSFLRLQREYPGHPTPLVIIGIVPDTISRILSRWKHFYEYGNVFAFKPQFIFKNNKLELLPNIVNNEEKFLNYKKYYDEISQSDYFFNRKFKDEIFTFPYIFSFFRNLPRNISIIKNISRFQQKKNTAFQNKAFMTIMKINLKWRLKLFKDAYAVDLLKSLIGKCVDYSKEKGFRLVIAFLPQKDDVLYTNKGGHFYSHLIDRISSDCNVFDMMPHLCKISDIDDYFSENNDYGGHYSVLGNKFVAEKMNEYIKQKKLLSHGQ